ncbi:hypothetical protein ACFL3S_01465 [Gemmatimonadota bacterium]
MSDERRFDDQEIAEILERATTREPAPARATSGDGLTLAELQEIGSEVGIPPERVAEAARAVASREASSAPRTFLGTPRSVSRIVPIDRALDDDEWTRLVVDLRETFEAVGTVRTDGPLRSWINGNLQVHVEPDGERFRVRMRTLKGETAPRAAISAAFIFLAAIFLLLSLLGEVSSSGFLIAAAFGLVGLGQLGYTRAMLPRWAQERASQMEGLAVRIPLLLEE